MMYLDLHALCDSCSAQMKLHNIHVLSFSVKPCCHLVLTVADFV